ncbi:MAG: rhomboid family intramembrane serine protease [Actinomycetota bacterium]|nr:rhomboid family intramembrane serine protease [Actinomycetota bacterium]
MIPLKDNIPTDRFPVVTVAFIAINVLVFVWQLTYSTDPQLSEPPYDLGNIDQSSLEYGAIPYRITHPSEKADCAIGPVETGGGQLELGVVCPGTAEYDEAVLIERSVGPITGTVPGAETSSGLDLLPLDQAPWYVSLFTSMFMHGGILHIAGNMLFLWVFGNNIEDSMGRLKFAAFYLAAGLVAVYSQAALEVDSTVPTIGASGAVAGVLGAYALLHPKARVLTLIFIIFFVTVVEIPALILLGIWFVLQFVPALGQVATPEVGGGEGIAYFAHVGGFIFGLAVVKLLARRREPPLPAVQG